MTFATGDIRFIGEIPVSDQETPKSPFTLYGLQPKDKRHRPNYTLVNISLEGMYCKAIKDNHKKNLVKSGKGAKSKRDKDQY